jgi:hypothetical protein
VIPLDFNLSADDHDKALRQGIGFVQDIALAEQITAVRLIVFDRGSNAIGSVTIPVRQGDPGKPD